MMNKQLHKKSIFEIDLRKMKYYLLRITTDINLNELLNTNKFVQKNGYYEYELTNESEIDCIEHFISFLQVNNFLLQSKGITKNQISIWLLYEYEEQCSLLLSAKQMGLLSQAGYDLCIDCWKADDNINLITE